MLEWQGIAIEPEKEVDITHDSKGLAFIRLTPKGFKAMNQPERIVIALYGNRVFMKADEGGWKVNNISKYRWQYAVGRRLDGWDGSYKLFYSKTEEAFYIEKGDRRNEYI